MAFPKESDWSGDIYNAGAEGFNPLVDFEKEINKVFPDTKPFTFGFFSEDDVRSRSTIGWVHLKGAHFGIENIDDWNSVVGLRFGLSRDAGDNVMYGSNYVMMMPKKHRIEVILPARKAAAQRMEAKADEDSVIVHPEDPNYEAMKERGRELASTTKAKVQVIGEPDRGSPDKGESKKKTTEKEADSW